MTEHIPLAVSISDAVKMVGLGRTSLYAAIAAGKLKTRKSGRRTLVETSALRQFIEALPESASLKVSLDAAKTLANDETCGMIVQVGVNVNVQLGYIVDISQYADRARQILQASGGEPRTIDVGGEG